MKTLTHLFAAAVALALALQSQAQCTATISGDTSVCAGESVELVVTVNTSDPDCPCSNGAINSATVVWSYNNQTVNNTGLDLEVTLQATTTVSVAITAPCLGEDSPLEAEVTITVNPLPSFDVELSQLSEPTCAGNDLIFTLDGSFPNPVQSYSWSGANSSNSSTATLDNAPLGALNVACTVTDNAGCSATSNTNFNVTNAVINITQSGDGSYCAGDQFSITASPAGTAAFLSCNWLVSETGFVPNPNNCSVTVNSASAANHDGTWQVSVTDINGCTATQAVGVQVDAPQVGISLGSTEVCTNASDVAINVTQAGGMYFMDTDCDSPDSNPIDVIGSEFDPSAAGPGEFCVCYTISSASGCTAEACAPITVNAPQQASFTGTPESTCKSGPEIDLSDFVAPAPSAGFSGTFTVNNCAVATSLNPDLPCIEVGFNPVVYTFTDNNGCTTTASSNIQIFEEVVASTPSDFDVCQGAVAQLNVSATGGNPNTYQYAWTPAGGLSNAGSSAPQVLSALETETYTATVTDANGCSASSSMVVSVFAQPEIINILQSPTSFCAGGSAELSLQNNWSSNDWDIVANYQWVYNGNLINTSVPSNLFDPIMESTVVVIQVAFGANGYNPGCESIFTNFSLDPVPDPAPVVVSNQNALCSGQVNLFTVSNTTDGSSFEWDFSPSPSELEILGNGNVALASWSGQSGMLTVNLTESLVNCFGEASVSLSLNNQPAPQSAAIALLGNSTLVYTDSEPDCYRWGFVDESGSINFLLNPLTNEPETFQTVVLNEINPSYLYFCEAWNGDCENPECSTLSVYDDAFVSVDENGRSEAFSVFPNPNSGEFWIRSSGVIAGNAQLVVHNQTGAQQFIEGLPFGSGEALVKVSLENYSPGIYLLSLYDDGRLIGSQRVLIQP